MALWSFHCYKPRAQSKSDLEKWRNGLTTRAKAKFYVTLRHLADQPQSGWEKPPKSPYAKRLGNGIWELRLFLDNVQHRPLGFFGPDQRMFCILLIAEEKGGEFIPKDALKQAIRRMEKVKADRRLIHEYQIL